MRILVVDDHEVVRCRVRSLLGAHPDVEVCGEAVDGADAIEKARRLTPDVIVMAIGMPSLNGLAATREIRRILPETQVLILSEHDLPEMMSQALEAGASGWVVKSANSTELMAALQKIREGEAFGAGALERALREREELFRSTFEQAAVGMGHVAENGTWLRVNRKLCEIVGYSEEELKHMTAEQMTHPEDLAKDLQQVARVIRGEIDDFAMEKRFLGRDGKGVWVSVTLAGVRDVVGRIKYFFLVIEDLAARKKAEEERMAAGEGFRAMVEAASDCVKLLAADGTVLHMNSAGLRMVEADGLEAVVGKSVFDLIAPADRDKFREFHNRVCAGERASLRFDMVGLEGGLRNMEAHGVPQRTPGGSLAHLSVARDVTESGREGIAQGRLAAIVESSEDAIISKNLDGIITSWNTAAEHIFGYAAEEVIGKSITVIIPPELQDEEKHILSRLRRGERIAHYETVRRRKDGARRDVSLTISPVRDGAGQIIGASKIARDITRRKITEQEKKEEELSGRLLQLQDEERRHIARELHDGAGQSLAALSMNLAAILRDRGGLSETAERLAEESLQLVRQVSAEIRTLSHLLHPPLLDEVGLKSALSEYVGGFSQRSGIDAKLQMADDCERLPRDCELSLFRIVQESLTNIHRHSGSATALVRLRRGPKEIRLEVIDEGKGIDREIQEEFLMGRSSGVGLRGMRERVRQIGGTLDILSDERGTAVVAVLPIRKEKQAREVSG